MSEEKKQPDLKSFETNLFGGLMKFQKRIISLVQDATLDVEQQKLVLDRMNSLVDTEFEDMKAKKDFNMSERLTSIAEQIERFIAELSKSE